MGGSIENLFRYEEKRLAAVRSANKRRWSDPIARQTFADKIRGFHVPPYRADEYRFLTKIKHIPSKEAGRMMGLT